MMTNAWKLDEASRQGQGTKGWNNGGTSATKLNGRAPPAKKAQEGVPANATEKALMKHIRDKIASRGARGIMGIGKKFKIADDNNSKSLDSGEFTKAMQDFRIGLTAPQILQAFQIFDRDGSGEITYDEFIRSVRGSMNPQREAIAMKAYRIMDSDGSGQLDINDIRQTYNAKQHPDVKSGKRSEDEILAEFLDTFEDHFCDMKGQSDARDGKISHAEWKEYYNNVSMSIDNEEYFALMMNNAWNLDGKKNTKKAWGGEV
jgi:Ca2+-binding EF-hand superfamily protein